MKRIAPSLLAADFTQLAKEVLAVAPYTDILHLDIMDGHFVPNISFGPAVIRQLRSLTSLYFDVHLMISEPVKYLTTFKDAGAQGITVHVETFKDIVSGKHVIDAIHSLGCEAGVTLKPGTDIRSLDPYLPFVERVLVMSVEPGFGGQSFLSSQLSKITYLNEYRKQHHLLFDIEVDGGVNSITAALCFAAGADTLVAGTSIYGTKDYKKAIEEMRSAQ